MSRRHALALAVTASLLWACGGTTPSTTSPSDGSASGCPNAAPAPLPAHQEYDVTMQTSMGTITMRVATDNSPLAVANFVALVSCGFYDGVIFHRLAFLQDGTPFVIQGGDPTGTGTGGPGYTIKDEPVLGSYRRGTLAMARTSAPDSQGSQFFIVLDNAAAGPLESARTYAILGEVTAGMDVVDAISKVARDGQDRPISPVTITKATATKVVP
jgi:cyclophilin family peptidyl-prolyl cis-trans isomerase